MENHKVPKQFGERHFTVAFIDLQVLKYESISCLLYSFGLRDTQVPFKIKDTSAAIDILCSFRNFASPEKNEFKHFL